MTHAYLYREVADKISTMVENGAFRPGDRIPSIRELSRQAKVSINTVKVAYSHLEDRRIIEARPQSGYYVCPPPLEMVREPKMCRDTVSPLEISSSRLVVHIMKDIMDPDRVQFGGGDTRPRSRSVAKAWQNYGRRVKACRGERAAVMQFRRGTGDCAVRFRGG